MANDSIFMLFDTAAQQSSPLFRPKGGTPYLYVWDDAAKKNDWRAFFAIASGVQFWEIGLTSKVIIIIISINE